MKDLTDFAVIVPTRGDRPQFFEFCKWQLDRQTLQPKNRYYIAYEPESEEMDLVKRIKSGVELAKRDGIDLVFICEDDDFYPSNYFERFAPHFKSYEFFGGEHTTYFNLRNKTYKTWAHPNRASLFTTGFKISALNLFQWPSDNEKFLDIKLWEYARRRKKKFIISGTVGIKHGLGKTAGKGHIMRLGKVDTDLTFLKLHVDPVSFQFYKDLMLTL